MHVPLLDDALWQITSRGLERIDVDDWQVLGEGARELARDERGDVTMACADGTIAKTFSLKRRVSSAVLRPYSARFARNCRRLLSLSVPAPAIVRLAALGHERRHVVIYSPLPGRTLREALAADPSEGAPLIASFGRFLATLHARGVEFRSLHLGNVIVQPDGAMGLVDVTDIRFARGPLSPEARSDNVWQVWSRNPADSDALALHARAFTRAYLDAAALGEPARSEFLAGLPAGLTGPAGLDASP